MTTTTAQLKNGKWTVNNKTLSEMNLFEKKILNIYFKHKKEIYNLLNQQK